MMLCCNVTCIGSRERVDRWCCVVMLQTTKDQQTVDELWRCLQRERDNKIHLLERQLTELKMALREDELVQTSVVFVSSKLKHIFGTRLSMVDW